MKIIILILIFAAHSLDIFGQCTSKVDEMTKEKIINTEVLKIGKAKLCGMCPKLFLSSSFMKIDSTFGLFLKAEGSSAWSIKENEIFYLKTENDSVLKIINRQYSISSITKGEAFTQGTNTIIFSLSISQKIDLNILQYLSTNKLVKIRVGIYDYEITKPEIIQEQIKCIMTTK